MLLKGQKTKKMKELSEKLSQASAPKNHGNKNISLPGIVQNADQKTWIEPLTLWMEEHLMKCQQGGELDRDVYWLVLFNCHINSLVTHSSNSTFHIHLSLYANGAVILSLTPTGLKRALRSLAQYSIEEEPIINYSKTKNCTLSKCPK
ncbi:hypothetical protein L345_08056, partial [Ophiophagus hannah]